MAMNKKITIISIVILLALLAGAGVWKWKNNPQNITEQQKQNEQNKNESDDLVTEKDPPVLEKIDTSNWQTYRNEEYGFEFKYPNIYLSDCSKIQNELSISISDTEKEDCYSWPDGRIGIGFEIYDKNKPDFHYDSYSIKKVKLNNQEIDQVIGYYEIKGSEGEILSYHPKSKVILSLIPYKNDKYILLSYSQLYSLEEGGTSYGFKIEKNIEDIYYSIVKSFKFF